MLVPATLLMGYLLWLAPRYPETHALFGDWYVHAESFTLFLVGYLVARDAGFWTRLHALRWKTLSLPCSASP